MALVDLLNPLLAQLKKALGPFGKLFDIVTRFWHAITDSISKSIALGQLVYGEVIAWKGFKEDIAYKTGVVSIPKAVEKTQELVQEVIAAWHVILDLVQSLRKQVQADVVGGEDPAAEARAALDDIEKSGFKAILKQFPKLARGLGKLAVWVGVVAGIAEAFVTLVDDLTVIVQALKDVREEVEHGATVFLQQKNPRKTVKLADGGKIKLRVGNLH